MVKLKDVLKVDKTKCIVKPQLTAPIIYEKNKYVKSASAVCRFGV